MRSRILILGGTEEARLLAGRLAVEKFDVVTSLAGVTQHPEFISGERRRGGFGGAEGLEGYLREGGFSALIDASHPFAERISRHAKVAAEAENILLFRLERPAWRATPDDRWIEVADAAGAANALPAGARALVTVGRKEADAFLNRPDICGVVRMIEHPSSVVPYGWRLILARPPFALLEELQLMARHEISHLVAKNSGGEQTHSKIIAAREKGIPVVMIRRPQKAEARTFETPGEVVAALRRALSA